MCELLGMSANVPTDICFSFAGLMERGGRTGPHKDGWGIAFYEEGGLRAFHDPHPSCHSPLANLVKDYPIKSEVVIGHIRQANVGDISLANTHPFTRELWGYYWTFAHNGQLKADDKPLSKTLQQWCGKHFQPVGQTDSERAFCYLLNQIVGTWDTHPGVEALQVFLQQHCLLLAELGVYNMLLSDGHTLFAFCGSKLHWLTRQSPFGAATLIDADVQVDFRSETSPQDIVTVVATEPLTDVETWQAMQPGELLVLRAGSVVVLPKDSSPSSSVHNAVIP